MARPVRARPTSVYRPRSGVAASRQSWRVHCARLPQQRSTRSALCHPCYFPEGRTETLRCRQPQAPTAEGARLNPKATAYVPLSSDGKGTQNHQCCARGASCHGEPFAGPGSLDPSQKRKNFMVSNAEAAEGAEEKESKKFLGLRSCLLLCNFLYLFSAFRAEVIQGVIPNDRGSTCAFFNMRKRL